MAGQPEGGARNTAKRAAGIVVLRRLPAGWQCLLLRAYRNWDFPKGLVEEGEMPLQAALREVREETGLAALRFPWGRMPQRESRAEALDSRSAAWACTVLQRAEKYHGGNFSAFPCGTDFRETGPYAGGKVARYYAAVADDGELTLPVSPALGRPEHHAFRWLDFDQAARLLAPRLRPILDWARGLTARAESA